MFSGAHILLYSKNPEADRAFFRDTMKFRHVDAGEGWLIFALPPAELGIHPVEDGGHGQAEGANRLATAELYLMCDDLAATMGQLKKQGIRCSEVERANWGMKTSITLPSGSRLGLYQPRHPTAV